MANQAPLCPEQARNVAVNKVLLPPFPMRKWKNKKIRRFMGNTKKPTKRYVWGHSSTKAPVAINSHLPQSHTVIIFSLSCIFKLSLSTSSFSMASVNSQTLNLAPFPSVSWDCYSQVSFLRCWGPQTLFRAETSSKLSLHLLSGFLDTKLRPSGCCFWEVPLSVLISYIPVPPRVFPYFLMHTLNVPTLEFQLLPL